MTTERTTCGSVTSVGQCSLHRLPVLLGVFVGFGLSGCTWPPGETGSADLTKFASLAEFKLYLAEQVEAEQFRYGWNFDFLTPVFGFPQALPDAAEPASPGTGSGGGGDFSTTNIQEVGVDESDILKNDGTYLYILDNDQIHIVRAVPADDMELVSTIELPTHTRELFLVGDTLVALGTAYDGSTDTDVTAVTIVDVSDRSSPSVVATTEADGSLVTSRLIGSRLHLVLSVSPQFPLGERYVPVLISDVGAMMPDITVTSDRGASETRSLVAWNDLYHPVDPDGYHITAVVTLNIEHPEEPHESVGVMANAGTVYVSPEALYVTDTDYNYEGLVREATDICKFRLTEDGAVPAGTGSVPGRILNRFSLGEHEGFLRVATTIGHVSRSGQSSATNNVYVVGEADDGLEIVGKVEEVAPGERIYAARFLGDRGFLVTFKKVDPLFTLDLSNPTAPRVIGELKVPGYSDYIHPLGQNHLLTIGKDAIDMGDFAWFQGVQISVFDVTDFAEPKLVDAEVIGDRGTESEALGNSHAFNYFASVGMLAVPMTIAEDAGPEPSNYGTTMFDGLCLFRIDETEGVEFVQGIATGSVEQSMDWAYLRRAPWTRGVFIGEHVYAVTNSAVQALPLTNLTAEPFHLSFD